MKTGDSLIDLDVFFITIIGICKIAKHWKQFKNFSFQAQYWAGKYICYWGRSYCPNHFSHGWGFWHFFWLFFRNVRKLLDVADISSDIVIMYWMLHNYNYCHIVFKMIFELWRNLIKIKLHLDYSKLHFHINIIMEPPHIFA